MDKLNVSYCNGENVLSAVIGPELVKNCSDCGLPLDFHVCRQKEINALKEEIKDLKNEIHAYQIGAK